MSVDSQMWAAVQAGREQKALKLVDASDEAVDALTAKLDAFLSEAQASRRAAVAQLPLRRLDDTHRHDRPGRRRGPYSFRDRIPC